LEALAQAVGDVVDPSGQFGARRVRVASGRLEDELQPVLVLEVALSGQAVLAAEVARVLVDDEVVAEK